MSARTTDDFPRTRTVIVARLLVAVVITVAALFGGTNVEVTAIVILGVIVAGLTGVYLLWDRYGHMPALLLQVQFAVDIVFVTLVVYFSVASRAPSSCSISCQSSSPRPDSASEPARRWQQPRWRAIWC